MNKIHPFNLQNGSYWDNKISVSADMVTCNSSAELDILGEGNAQRKEAAKLWGGEKN